MPQGQLLGGPPGGHDGRPAARHPCPSHGPAPLRLGTHPLAPACRHRPRPTRRATWPACSGPLDSRAWRQPIKTKGIAQGVLVGAAAQEAADPRCCHVPQPLGAVVAGAQLTAGGHASLGWASNKARPSCRASPPLQDSGMMSRGCAAHIRSQVSSRLPKASRQRRQRMVGVLPSHPHIATADRPLLGVPSLHRGCSLPGVTGQTERCGRSAQKASGPTSK